MNAGDWNDLRTVYAEDIYAPLPPQRQGIRGAGAIVKAVREWSGAFPDLHGVHVDGATATIEVTFTGT
jgi:hypothetical protein